METIQEDKNTLTMKLGMAHGPPNVGVDDSSTNRLGSSVAERPACDGVVPGSIPGLAFSFSSYTQGVRGLSFKANSPARSGSRFDIPW